MTEHELCCPGCGEWLMVPATGWIECPLCELRLDADWDDAVGPFAVVADEESGNHSESPNSSDGG